MLRYLRLLGIQLRASATVAMQYRLDFVVQGALALFWSGWALVPVVVVFGGRRGVAGWRFEEALVVIGWFMVMKGVLEGAVNPSLASVVEHIRKGTLDFVLLKPADAHMFWGGTLNARDKRSLYSALSYPRPGDLMNIKGSIKDVAYQIGKSAEHKPCLLHSQPWNPSERIMAGRHDGVVEHDT